MNIKPGLTTLTTSTEQGYQSSVRSGARFESRLRNRTKVQLHSLRPQQDITIHIESYFLFIQCVLTQRYTSVFRYRALNNRLNARTNGKDTPISPTHASNESQHRLTASAGVEPRTRLVNVTCYLELGEPIGKPERYRVARE